MYGCGDFFGEKITLTHWRCGVIRLPKLKLNSEQKLRIYLSPRHIANAQLAAVRSNAAYDPLSKMIICKIK